MSLREVAARPGPRPTRAVRSPVPWLLGLGWAAQVALRLWFARGRAAPSVLPDEAGYLVAARLLAGGPAADLSGGTFYQGGYPLLLVPAYALGRDPATAYALVLLINAVVGAALFPLGYLAARRLGLERRAALAVSWAVAALPAATFFGMFALADAVLPVVVLGWLLAVHGFLRARRTGLAVLASLLAGYAAAVHARGAVLVAVQVIVLAVPAVHGIRRLWGLGIGVRSLRAVPPASIAGLVVLGAGQLLQGSYNAWLRAEVDPSGVRDLAGNLGERLTSLDGQAWALSGAAGQIWYLTVSTWGLAGAGLVAAAVVAGRRRAVPVTRLLAMILLAVTVGIAYASSGALPDEHRVGNFAYGRYLACLAPVWAIVGCAALARLPLGRAVRCARGGLLLMAALGLWVALYAGERLRTHRFIAFDFPEVSFLTGDRTALRLVPAMFVAAALLCLLTAALGPGRTGVAAVLLAGVNVAALGYLMGPYGPHPPRDPPGPPLAGTVASGGVVTDRALHWRLRVAVITQVSWTEVVTSDVHTRPIGPDVCAVVVPWPGGVPMTATWPERPGRWLPRPAGSTPWRSVTWANPHCLDPTPDRAARPGATPMSPGEPYPPSPAVRSG